MSGSCVKASILIVLIIAFAGVAYASSSNIIGIMSHTANSSLDNQTIWVKSNSSTNFSITFENINSSNNDAIFGISIVSDPNANNGIFLKNVNCSPGWNNSSNYISKHITCTANSTSVLQPNQTVTITAIISANVTNSSESSLWTWTTQDNDTAGTTTTIDSGWFNINIDASVPNITITHPNTPFVNSTNITVEWNGNDTDSNISHYEIQTDGANWTNVGLNISYNITNLSEGNHNITIKAVDNVGNEANDSVNFTVDTILPNITIIHPNTSFVNSTNLTIEWNGTDNVSGINYYEIKMDNGNWTNVGLNLTYNFTSLSEGNHNITVKAFDNAGNEANDSVNFTVDTLAPNVSITSPADGSSTTSTSVTVNWNGNDNTSGISHYDIKIDGGGWTDVGASTSHTFSSLSYNTHTVIVKAFDNAGNEANDSVSFTITKPYTGGGGGGYIPIKKDNNPPTVTRPMVNSTSVYANETLMCLPGIYSDKDNNTKVSDSWRWYVNNKLIDISSQKFNLAGSNITAGDEIYCAERVYDGTDYSDWVYSKNKAYIKSEPAPLNESNSTIPPIENGRKTLSPNSVNGLTGAFINSSGSMNILGVVSLITLLSIISTFFIIKIFWNRTLIIKLK